MKKQPSPQTYILHGYWCSEFHGTDGPLRIEHHSPSPLSHKLVEAGKSLGYPPSNDYNTGSTQGKLFYNVHYIIRILLVAVCRRANCSRKKKQKTTTFSKGYFQHPALMSLNIARNITFKKCASLNCSYNTFPIPHSF